MNRKQLAHQHIEMERRIKRAAELKVTKIWTDLGSYNEIDVPRWLERVVPVVHGAQLQSVAVTEAYLARAMERQPIGFNPDELTGPAVRGGLAPEAEWQRPFIDVWTGLKNGNDWATAVAFGLNRATTLATTDVTLSMRETARQVGQADTGIYGFERVPNAGACELCEIASTQRYHTDDLMPIHDHCNCGVEPLTEPTEQVINRDLYRELKSEARDTPNVTVAVTEHGELGPVLAAA